MGVRIDTRFLLKISSISLFFILTILPLIYLYASNFSLDDYFWILKDKRQQEIFLRTMQLGLGTMLLSVILGVVVAVLLEYTDLPFRSYLKILVLIPLLIPPYITTISWLMFLGKAGDFAERWESIPGRLIQQNLTSSFSIPTQKATPWYLPFDIDVYNVESAIFILSFCLFPLVFLITSFALKNIDSRLEDAARLLYPKRTVLRKVTLPLILPHIIVSGLFVFIFAVSELGVPSALRVYTTVMEIFSHFSAFFDTTQAIGISFPLVLSIAFLILLIHLLLGRRSFITVSSFSRKGSLIKLTPAQKILSLVFISILLLISSFIPMFVLLLQSRFMFIDAFLKAEDSFFNTLFLGILSATLMVVLSFFVAFFSGRGMDPIILFPLILPSAAVGIGLIVIWNNDLTGAIYGSFLILVIGYLARFLPFTIKTLSPFFEQIHPSLEESGRLSGASFFRTTNEILLPLMKRGILTAWVVGFILCLRELTISVLVTPPGFQTLPNRIFTLYHCGEIESVAALSIILISMILAPVFLFVVGNKIIKKWHT